MSRKTLAELPDPAPMAPVWDALDNKRARFVRRVDADFVELADNDGKTLPDYRNVLQVEPYENPKGWQHV